MAAEVAELILKSFSELRKTVQQAQKLLTPIALLGLVTGVERGMRRLETLPTPDEESPLYSARYNLSKGSLHVALGQLIEAERLFAIALGITERYALYDNIHALHNNLGVCLLEQGRFDEAKMALQSALEFAAETSPSEKSTAQDNLSLLAYESGAYEEGLQNAASLLAAQEIHGWRAILDLWAVVGLCSLEIGDLTQAREAEREIHAHTPRSGQLGNDMSYVHIFLARMLASRNQSDVALRSLQLAVQNYRPRNRLAAARMELEKFRLQLKTGIDCTADIDALLADLRGSGAVPLIERAEGLQTRARLKRR
jgi:tetratricopeptide (TPR) repeat protein